MNRFFESKLALQRERSFSPKEKIEERISTGKRIDEIES